jgi:lipopolysaccharide biosynthesis regulator YciM
MLRLDPRFIIPALLLCACARADESQPADADPVIAGMQEQIAADTSNWLLHAQLAAELRRKDRLAEAGVAAEKAFAMAPAPGIEARLEMAKVHAAAERSASAINLVKDAEKRKRAGEVVDEVKIAEVYAVLGDTAAVFRWLDRAVLAESPNVATLQANPDFTSVHDDPRWAALLAPAR